MGQRGSRFISTPPSTLGFRQFQHRTLSVQVVKGVGSGCYTVQVVMLMPQCRPLLFLLGVAVRAVCYCNP